MSILSGYKKVKDRILTEEGFKLLSRWTSSDTVECTDGNTVETKVGAINGISSSPTATAADVASSIGYVNEINAKFSGCWIDFTDAEGNPTTEPYIHWLEEVQE